MSRKHFVELASQISKISDARARREAALAVAQACAATTPNFDRSKFMSACNAVGE